MDKKSTLILLSILHICILGVCILTIYNNKHSGVTVAHVSFDTKTAVTPKETAKEPETEAGTEEPGTDTGMAEEPEAEAGTVEETVEEPETEEKPEAETPEKIDEPESAVRYSFRYTGTRNKLNMRSAPSMDAEIIGKVPVGGSGSVLELTDEEWIRAEYDGVVGYCSRKWIELQEIAE